VASPPSTTLLPTIQNSSNDAATHSRTAPPCPHSAHAIDPERRIRKQSTHLHPQRIGNRLSALKDGSAARRSIWLTWLTVRPARDPATPACRRRLPIDMPRSGFGISSAHGRWRDIVKQWLHYSTTNLWLSTNFIFFGNCYLSYENSSCSSACHAANWAKLLPARDKPLPRVSPKEGLAWRRAITRRPAPERHIGCQRHFWSTESTHRCWLNQ
jgi:hypothetical protein